MHKQVPILTTTALALAVGCALAPLPANAAQSAPNAAPLQITVHGFDPAAGRAEFTVTGNPNDTATFQDFTVPLGQDGAEFGVTGLAPGSNVFHATSYSLSGKKTGEAEVDLVVQDGNAAATSLYDSVVRPAQASGVAAPGSEIAVLDSHGDEVARADSDPTSGRWSALVPAPNAGGVHEYTVESSDAADGPVGLPIDFGAAVRVTDAESQDTRAAGLHVDGEGVAGGEIQVRAQGESEAVGTTEVASDGTWSIDVPDAPTDDTTYVATQTGKGNNITSAQFVADGDGAAEVEPLVVSKPVADSVVVAPTGAVDFAGTGADGATVTVRGLNGGRPIGTAVVANGAWSFTGKALNPNMRYTLETVYQVPGQAAVLGTVRFTTTPTAGATKPFAVDRPVRDGVVVAPTGEVAFAGTGTTGDRVVVKGQGVGGRTVVDTTVDEHGNWSKTGQWLNPSLHYTLETVYTPAGGAPVTGTISFTTQSRAGVTKPFTIAKPVQNSHVETTDGTVQFSGTGTTGDRVIIKGQGSNGRTVVDATVDVDGNWSGTGRSLNTDLTYTLDTISVAQSGAAQTGTVTFTTTSRWPTDWRRGAGPLRASNPLMERSNGPATDGDGSADRPWTSLSAAEAALRVPGSGFSGLTFMSSSSGSPFVIESALADAPVTLDGGGPGGALILDDVSNVIVRNMVCTNNGPATAGSNAGVVAVRVPAVTRPVSNVSFDSVTFRSVNCPASTCNDELTTEDQSPLAGTGT